MSEIAPRVPSVARLGKPTHWGWTVGIGLLCAVTAGLVANLPLLIAVDRGEAPQLSQVAWPFRPEVAWGLMALAWGAVVAIQLTLVVTELTESGDDVVLAEARVLWRQNLTVVTRLLAALVVMAAALGAAGVLATLAAGGGLLAETLLYCALTALLVTFVQALVWRRELVVELKSAEEALARDSALLKEFDTGTPWAAGVRDERVVDRPTLIALPGAFGLLLAYAAACAGALFGEPPTVGAQEIHFFWWWFGFVMLSCTGSGYVLGLAEEALRSPASTSRTLAHWTAGFLLVGLLITGLGVVFGAPDLPVRLFVGIGWLAPPVIALLLFRLGRRGIWPARWMWVRERERRTANEKRARERWEGLRAELERSRPSKPSPLPGRALHGALWRGWRPSPLRLARGRRGMR